MRYGVMYGYFHKDWEGDYLPDIKRLSELGFDAMEIHTNSLLERSDRELEEIRKACEAYNIMLTCDICLGGGTDISDNDPEIRKNGIRYATELLKKIHKLGCSNVAGINYVGWNCFEENLNREQRTQNSITCMKEIIKTAEELGIVYGVEVTNRFEQFMLNTAAEGVAYCRQVGSPNIAVQLDINHMLIEEDDIYGAILTAGPLLSHLHVAESNRRVPKGGGFVPWNDLARGLREIGYDRCINLEPLAKMGGQVAKDAKMWSPRILDTGREALEKDIVEGLHFIRSVIEGEKA